MGIFDFLKTTSYEVHEKKGDALAAVAEFGQAKQAYEKALVKLEHSSISDPLGTAERIRAKITRTKDALARQHATTAEDLMEAGYYDDAVELLELAGGLASDADLAGRVEKLLTQSRTAMQKAALEPMEADALPEEAYIPDSDEEYFAVLCSALPEDLQAEYENYGYSFTMGYIALNRGAFALAVEYLSEALEEQEGTVTHIHLELATACLNLGETERCRTLLLPYVAAYPLAVRAYELLCEIYWEQHAFSKAEELLSGCPDSLKTSPTVMQLMGETLFKSGDYEAAEAFYQNSLDYAGWHESIAVALARTQEAMGRPEKARRMYGDILETCKSCRRQATPFVKQRFAELGFQEGDTSTSLLETYHALCNEDPQNRSHYYRRLSDIYSRRGDHEEARRYAKFAETGQPDR